MVLVSHTHKIIFLKTRKTAGTSVEMLLEAATGLEPDPPAERRHAKVTAKGLVGFRRVPRDAITDLDRTWQPHTPARRVRARLGRQVWDTYLKVACIRNPFDRVVSQFHWQKSRSSPQSQDEGHESFAEFVRGDWNNDHNVVMIGDDFVPNALIRYEHLSQDLAVIADRTGLNLDPSALPQTKVRRARRSGAFATYYTEELAQIVRERFAWAFTHGGYAQELPTPQMQSVG